MHAARAAFEAGQSVQGITAVLQMIVLAIPVAGILLMLFKLLGSGLRSGWRRTEGRPVLRTLFSLLALTAIALLLYSWMPGDNYTPIRPGERGTLSEATGAVRRLPHGDAPLYSEQLAQQRESGTVTDPSVTPDAPDASTTSTTIASEESTSTTIADSFSNSGSTTSTSTASPSTSTSSATASTTATTSASTTTTVP